MNSTIPRLAAQFSRAFSLCFAAMLALAFVPACGTDMLSMAETGRDALCKENCKRLEKACSKDCEETEKKVAAVKASGAALPPELQNWTIASCNAECDAKHGDACVKDCEEQYSPDALPE